MTGDNADYRRLRALASQESKNNIVVTTYETAHPAGEGDLGSTSAGATNDDCLYRFPIRCVRDAWE